MPCEHHANGLTICRPDLKEQRIRILYCPKCKQRRRVIQRIYSGDYYWGAFAACTAMRFKWAHWEPCGQEWTWGE